jgi:ABC-type phosphate transport system substrate-binding protein
MVPYGWRTILAAVVLAAATTSASGAQEFQVIVHPSVQGTRISKTSLSALFTGKTFRWGDKSQALPVDQSAKTPVRRAFTTTVIGLSLGELQLYWQRRVSTEHVFPPPIKDSDEEVLAFVAKNAGAIGYIGPDTPVPDSVRVIAVVD